MSGTSIVPEWHSVSFRILLSITSTTFSTFSLQLISATGRAEVVRSVVDSQGHALSVVGGSDGTNPDGNKSGQKQSIWKQMDRRRVVLLWMSIPWVAEVLAAYTV